MKDIGLVDLRVSGSQDTRRSNEAAIDVAGPHRELVKKLDWRVMPLLYLIYLVMFLDRSSVANGTFGGLAQDLNLKDNQLNTTIVCFFAGYVMMQIPSNAVITQKWNRPSKHIGFFVICWGILAACTPLVKTFEQFATLRFFIGFIEAPFYPGALYILHTYYTREEVSARIAILYAGNMTANAAASPFALACHTWIDGKLGLSSWEWVYIIQGSLGVILGSCSLFLLPDHPKITKWLSSDERQRAIQRIFGDTAQAGPEEETTLQALKEILKDPMLYLFCFMQHMHIAACGFSNFYPILLKSLGFRDEITLGLTAPPFLVAAVIAYYVATKSGQKDRRAIYIVISMSCAVAGFAITCATMNPWARYAACFIYVGGGYTVNSIILGWAGLTIGRTHQRKAHAMAIINVSANFAHLYTPHLYLKNFEPRYLLAWIANTGFAVLTILAAIMVYCTLKRKNARIGTVGGQRFAY